MKYVIMADGKGSRWNNYMGHSKHDIVINGETLLERSSRLLHELDKSAEVIITSHNEGLSVPGAKRYEPLDNVLEIDRFTRELIDDDMCFLYGDVYYSEDALKTVLDSRGKAPLLFIGSEKSICAVLVGDGKLFSALCSEVRRRFLAGETAECKGWQVYHLYAGLPLEGRETGRDYLAVDSFTRDFNSPEDYRDFISGHPFSKGDS